MAKVSSSVGKVARSINTAIKKGARNAANAALKVVDKSVRKEIKDATGLSKDRIDGTGSQGGLVWTYKATSKVPKVKIQIATKQGLNLSDEAFKPKQKAIRRTVKGAHSKHGVIKRNYKATYYGATVKIGKTPRQLIPDAFYSEFTVGKSKKKQIGLVLRRRGKGRLPVDALKTDILQKTAAELQVTASKQLKEIFDRTVDAEIDKAMAKALDSNDGTGE